MNTRTLLRAGAAAALAIGFVVVAGPAGPAYAADGPDVAVTPKSLSIAEGVKRAKAKPFVVELDNLGNAVAADVVVKVELDNLDGGVGWKRPEGCEKAGRLAYTCAIGDILPGQDYEFGVPLFSIDAFRGSGGFFKVTATVAGDTNLANNVVEADITVKKKTYDFTVWAQDVYAGVVADGDEVGEETRTPVTPGDTAPFDSAIFNHGSKRVVGVTYTLKLPDHVEVASAPADCEAADVPGFALFCENADVVLKPGEVLLPAITVKVAADAPAGVIPGGVLHAQAITPDGDDAERAGDEARMATQSQKKEITEADEGDNDVQFVAVVGTAPSSPPASPNPDVPGGGGGGDGLPVTGTQTALIAGVGAAILAAGLVLVLVLRRRRTFTAE
ncbi:LPXTG cell wall anchor domain-containing protein [Asanoa siamensis]|uniref:LPXTG-motif cell wall-anchored protein n=1 Tax=Asanoa siamensis TaxID=926357 RepID=A0ABQ4CZD7_9ACTN|nr:LPXTG cell wall anchor domain-containing protein [Asanoa siamensis]GIF76646.1 hypothetical protein Asi02nite_61640 [Asanoa siamensis]